MHTYRIAAAVTASLALMALAVVVGATWVDAGDATCGALYTPQHWDNHDGCSRRLLWRGLVVGLLVLVAATVVLGGVRHRHE